MLRKKLTILSILTLIVLVASVILLRLRLSTNNQSQPAVLPTPQTQTIETQFVKQIAEITAKEDLNDLELTSDQKTLYVPSYDENLIYVIDTQKQSLERKIWVPLPWVLALNQKADTLWVASGQGKIFALDPQTSQIKAQAKIGEQAVDIKLTDDEKLLLVAHNLTDDVYVFAAEDLELLSVIPVGRQPRGLAIADDLDLAFVSNFDESSISVISLSSLTEISKIRFYGRPNQLLYDKKRQLLYATDSFQNQILVIDPLELKVVSQIVVDPFPFGLTLNPKGDELWVTSYTQGSVNVLDLEKLSFAKNIKVSGGFVGAKGFNNLVFVPNQKLLFLTNTLTGQILSFPTDF